MRFNKKYKGRKRPARKSRKRARKSNVVRIVKNVLASKSETKFGILNVVEQAVNTTSSPTSANNVLLNNPAAGTAAYNRIGNQVRLQRVDIRGNVNQGDANIPIMIKLMVIKCSIDNDPLVDLMEENNALLPPASNDLKIMYARINTTKYTVLATRYLTLQSTAGGMINKLFHMNINLKGMKCKWDQTQTYPENQIRFIYFCRRLDRDDALTTSYDAEITWNAKVYYKDI